MAAIALISHQGFAAVNFRKTLIKLLVSEGHQVYVLAPDYKYEEIQSIKLFGATPVYYPLSRAGLNPIMDSITILRLFSILRRLKVDASFSFSVKPVIFGSIAAYLAGVKNKVSMIEGLGYVFTDNIIKKYPSALEFKADMPRLITHAWQWIDGRVSKTFLRIVVKLLYKLAFRLTDRVIFLNSDDIDYFTSVGVIDASRCINLGGIGVDLTEWVVVPISPKPLTFIMVARLLKEKGIYEYIEAIRLLKPSYPDIRFLLLGSTDLNPGSVPAATLQEWVSEGLVECPGHVDIKPWMTKSSVFVLPSYREGVPRSTQEAMAMGRPVITTDVAGCRETVLENENGFLVPVGDALSLAVAMQRFIRNPDIIKTMGARSRAIAEVKFNAIDKDAMILAQLLPCSEPENVV